MNANSKPTTVLTSTINSWLLSATSQLESVSIPSARLDAELILAHVLGQSRTWLIAHTHDDIIDLSLLKNGSKLLEKRLQRIPIAYLTNNKEFYGRDFYVDQRVLIPRPESETIIDILKQLINPTEVTRLLDLGTGSGCLGVTAKLEMPYLEATLSDISKDTLEVARRNANSLKAHVQFVQSDLLSKFQIPNSKFDIIIANLPYVNPVWEQSPETAHEPSLALYADDNGLELIKKCVQQAHALISVGSYLILEADLEQHPEIIRYAGDHFSHVETRDYIMVLQKTV